MKRSEMRAFSTIVALTLLLWSAHAEAFVYKVLHNFRGRDGALPSGGLIVDQNGIFYGVTSSGGLCANAGCGTIYKLSAKGKETVLYSFLGGAAGSYPVGPLLRDGAGNLYGVAGEGGSTACGNSAGCGLIFKLSPDGSYSVLHAFTGGADDGTGPAPGLTVDDAGNLYGATAEGGGYGCGNEYGCGTIYRLAPDGTETILYAFQGKSDGANPGSDLLRDTAGNLYGTTYYGGNTTCIPFGCGVVFELPVDGEEKVLHAFDQSDGNNPDTGLTADSKGNLYGATYSLKATLYRLSPTDGLTTLFRFNPDDGYGTFPHGDILLDRKGNLLVNNLYGGNVRTCSDGCGTVFKLTTNGSASVLHDFGAWPQDGIGGSGNLVIVGNKLYGTSAQGGEYGDGTVWVRTL